MSYVSTPLSRLIILFVLIKQLFSIIIIIIIIIIIVFLFLFFFPFDFLLFRYCL